MGKGSMKITIAEAIEQGFKYFCDDGGEQMLHLSDYLKEGVPLPPDRQIYWLIGTTPHHFSISAEEIKQSIVEIAENQEEFGDEDAELCDIVDEVYEEWKDLFDKISFHLNERYKKKSFLMPTDIQVV